MERIYGIDLGTTNSCIAFADDDTNAEVVNNFEGKQVTPSVVFFESPTEVVVGETAENDADESRMVFAVKRHIGKNDGFSFPFNGRNLKPEEISAYILKKVIQGAEDAQDEKVQRLVITHPAYFGVREKKATRNAALILGFRKEDVFLIPEPVAAAYSYGIRKRENVGKTVLVYDLGGGTFDATLIKIEEEKISVICTGGNPQLGGLDWDERILEYGISEYTRRTGVEEAAVFDEYNSRKELLDRARTVKHTLTTRPHARFKIHEELIDISLDQFNEMTSDLCERTIVLAEQMIEDAKQKLGEDYKDFDEILLVGGATRMKQIKENVESRFPGVKVSFYEPDLAVAKGAALYGYSLNVSQKPELLREEEFIDIENVTPKAFGMLTYYPKTDSDGNEDGFEQDIEIIIEKHTALPASRTTGFKTIKDDQMGIGCIFCETDANPFQGMRVQKELGIYIDRLELSFGKAVPKGTPIEVTVTMDKQGLLQFTARDPASGNEQSLKFNAGMTDEEILEARDALSNVHVG